jgi:ribosomal protein S18 acetylase RimI-like enzyme
MAIVQREPGLGELSDVVRVVGAWQRDGAPVQLHPGDLGWNWRFGPAATAAAIRTWSRDGEILAVGLVDSPVLLRLAIAPASGDDVELARRLADDLTGPEQAGLPPRIVSVEARFGNALRERLVADGWVDDEPWAPLRRDLTEPVEDHGVRVELIGPKGVGGSARDRLHARVRDRVAVQRAAFEGSTFTEEGWHAMASGPAYGEARCVVAYDDHGSAVAAATVWSAGPGRPGLLEPVGVHRDHRGLGYGTAVTVAAAAVLRGLGSSSATVCTPSANVGAVATYASAGFERLADVRDLRRSA